jgi:hypothetical protein
MTIPRNWIFISVARIGALPDVPHHDLVTLGDNVFDRHLHIRKFLQSISHVLFRTRSPRWRTGRHVCSMINGVTGKIHVCDGEILTHEVFKMVADKVLHLFY